MVKITGKEIQITKGDTLTVQVALNQASGEPYVPGAGDKIRFALKRRYTDTDCLILKEIPTDTMVLRLEAADTEQLVAQRRPYVYDIEITMANGTVDTFIDRGAFYVTEEVD